MKTKTKTILILLRLNACPESIEWASALTAEQAWETCERADWMLWLGTRICRPKLVVRAACSIARAALKHIPAGEDRPRIAIETAERWCSGDATLSEVKRASLAASKAAASSIGLVCFAACAAAFAGSCCFASRTRNATYADPVSFADSVYFADRARNAPYTYPVSAVYFAERAATAFAFAIEDAAQKENADIVRKHIPFRVISPAMEKVATSCSA